MSHITKVKTQLKDGMALRQALRNIQYRTYEGGTIYSSYFPDQRTRVEFLAVRSGKRIGFKTSKQEGGCYEILGDWQVMKVPPKEIVNEISQAYSTEKVLRIARQKGYSVIQNNLTSSGRQEILLRKVI